MQSLRLAIGALHEDCDGIQIGIQDKLWWDFFYFYCFTIAEVICSQ